MKKFFAMAILAAFMCVVPNSGAFAQTEINYFTPEQVVKYNVYEYPSPDSYFYLPNNFQTEFTITNGKFFMIENHDFLSDRKIDIDVYFYSHCDTLMGKVRIREGSMVHRISIPHKPNTLECKELKVKIVNRTSTNKDFKFLVFEPVNAVKGVPTPNSKYICGDECCGNKEK